MFESTNLNKEIFEIDNFETIIAKYRELSKKLEERVKNIKIKNEKIAKTVEKQ